MPAQQAGSPPWDTSAPSWPSVFEFVLAALLLLGQATVTMTPPADAPAG